MERVGLGLRATIVLTITVVMLITMLLIGFVVLTFAKKNIYDQKIETGEVVLNALQHIILSSIKDLPDRFMCLSSHNNRMSYCQFSKFS